MSMRNQRIGPANAIAAGSRGIRFGVGVGEVVFQLELLLDRRVPVVLDFIVLVRPGICAAIRDHLLIIVVDVNQDSEREWNVINI